MVIEEDVKSNNFEEHLPIIKNLNQFSEFPTSLSRHKTSNGLDPLNVGMLSVTPAKLASAVPSDPKLENLTAFQHLHHFTETPSSLSSAAISNKLFSQDTDIFTFTPEKLLSLEPSDVKQDPDHQKKRRLKALQNHSYPEMHCPDPYFVESTAQFALPCSINSSKKTDQRSKNSFEDDEKVKLESFKSENQTIPLPFSHLCNEMELHIACSSCKNPLGLPENRFLVKSLLMPSSKVFLTYIRTYGTRGSFMPERLSKTPRIVINVVSSEIMFIDELVIKGRADIGFSNHGVWCGEDGCVFKRLFCPFCEDHDTCLGVHVLATDASNANLLNKVLFYADCLCISEPKTSNENTLPKGENLTAKCSDHFKNEEPAYNIMKNTGNPQYLLVENEEYDCEISTKKPAFGRRPMLSVLKNADNNQSKPLEIEKFAYRPEAQQANFEKYTYCSQPMKACNPIHTTKSKLKLPRRQ